MKLYAGIDLHSNNSYVVLAQADEKVVYEQRLPNNLSYIKNELHPFKERMLHKLKFFQFHLSRLRER